MLKFENMKKVRKGIPTWQNEMREFPFIVNSHERVNDFANDQLENNPDFKVHLLFDPCPTVILKNPWSVDDQVTMQLTWQWGVVDKFGITHQHYSDITAFSNNPYLNPEVKTEVNTTWSWSSIFPMYHCDWRLQVWEMDSNYNLKVINDLAYDASCKNVYIHIDAKSKEQAKIWMDRCLKYKENHNCNMYLTIEKNYFNTTNTEGFTIVNSRDEIPGIVYSSFYIGYAPKELFGYGMFGDYGYYAPDNKYLGEDRIGFNPVGNSLIYSAANPRDPNVLSDKQIADDILGVSTDWDLAYGS